MIINGRPRWKKAALRQYGKDAINIGDILELWGIDEVANETLLGSTICSYEWPYIFSLEEKHPEIYLCYMNKLALVEEKLKNEIAYELGFGKTEEGDCVTEMWEALHKEFGWKAELFQFIKWKNRPEIRD